MYDFADFTNEERGRLALCPLCARPLKTEKTYAMPDGMWMRCKCGFRAFVFKCQAEPLGAQA